VLRAFAPTSARLATTLASTPGDFCGVAVDSRTDRVALLASKLGLPPLYYYFETTTGILLASDELDAIVAAIAALGRHLTLDRAYAGYFLTGLPDNNLSTAPLPTIYREIKSLPAANVMMIDRAAGRLQRYWAYWDKPQLPKRTVAEHIHSVFLKAVGARTVPGKAGVLLSGGLDSSSVAGALAHLSPAHTTYCYSNVFSSPSIDERFYAEAVVTRAGARGRYIPADDLWALKDVPDSSRRPQPEPWQGWFYAQEKSIAEAAREDGIEVIMDGVGGDELFTVSLTGGRYEFGGSRRTSSAAERLRLLGEVRLGRTPRGIPTSFVFDQGVIPPFLSGAFCAEINLPDRVQQPLLDLTALALDIIGTHRAFSFNFLNNFIQDSNWANREVYRPNGIDRRHPYLDHRLVEAIFRTPINELVSPSVEKPLLRKAFKNLLPTVVAKRKLGVAFGAALFKGIVEEEAARLMRLMSEALVYELGFVERRSFESHLRAFVEGTGVRTLADSLHQMHMWQVFMLEMWLKDQTERGSLTL
jgi:asparagine synthase (glutamine-hydrolysing)